MAEGAGCSQPANGWDDETPGRNAGLLARIRNHTRAILWAVRKQPARTITDSFRNRRGKDCKTFKAWRPERDPGIAPRFNRQRQDFIGSFNAPTGRMQRRNLRPI